MAVRVFDFDGRDELAVTGVARRTASPDRPVGWCVNERSEGSTEAKCCISPGKKAHLHRNR